MTLMNGLLYDESSYNPFARLVRLNEQLLQLGFQQIPLVELNLLAMADAYLRGQWLGGGGAERPFGKFGTERGIVPLTRVSGAAVPIKPRRPAEFAEALGELAVRHSGGPDTVRQHAEYAQALDVPLWIARRTAPGPHGPVTVTVDRLTTRVDVWSERAPLVRLRAPAGLSLRRKNPTRGLAVTIGDQHAQLVIDTRMFSRKVVTLWTADQEWLLCMRNGHSSELLRDKRQVAVITKPPRSKGAQPLLPLAEVSYGLGEPVDAVVAHALAVSFGIGRHAGTVRFSDGHYQQLSHVHRWEQPWFTGVGSCDGDSGPGAGGDGWGGGDGGGDGGGGSDGGGGGGDGGGGGGG